MVKQMWNDTIELSSAGTFCLHLSSDEHQVPALPPRILCEPWSSDSGPLACTASTLLHGKQTHYSTANTLFPGHHPSPAQCLLDLSIMQRPHNTNFCDHLAQPPLRLIIMTKPGSGGTQLWSQHPEGRDRQISMSLRPAWSTAWAIQRNPILKIKQTGAGEMMAQWLRAPTALPEVLSSILSNHMVAHNHL